MCICSGLFCIGEVLFRKESLLCSGDPNGQHAVCREGEVKSFFEIMVRAREKEEILVGLKYKGHKSPQLNPKSKAEQVLSLKTVSSLVVILTGVDPDKPSRHASWVGEVPSTSTSSVGDLSSIEKGINSLAWAP